MSMKCRKHVTGADSCFSSHEVVYPANLAVTPCLHALPCQTDCQRYTWSRPYTYFLQELKTPKPITRPNLYFTTQSLPFTRNKPGKIPEQLWCTFSPRLLPYVTMKRLKLRLLFRCKDFPAWMNVILECLKVFAIIGHGQTEAQKTL